MGKIRLYIKSADILDILAIRDKDTIHKLRNVLRLKKGSLIYIFDGEGREYSYIIEDINKHHCRIRQKEAFTKIAFSQKRITLAFPLVREDKIDFILQKGTELGVHHFIPFCCDRTLNIKCSKAKLARWNKIIIEATRQSERFWLPTLSNILTLEEVTSCIYDYKLVAAIQGEYFKGNFEGKSYAILIVVGPEGGFSESEKLLFDKNKFKTIKLSPNILRVETACILSIGLINYFINENCK